MIPDLDTLIVESALDYGILAMDLSATVVRWSRGAERMLGWSVDEALGQMGEIIFTAEDRRSGIPAREIETCLRCGSSIDERWHLRKDQTRFWASGEMMTLRAPDGSAIGLLKIIQDRTERWLAEQKQLSLAKLGEGLANMAKPQEMANLASELVRATLNCTGACYATVSQEIQLEGFSLGTQLTHTTEHLMAACREGMRRGAAAPDLLRGRDVCVTAERGDHGAYCVVPLFESQRIVAIFAIIDDGDRLWTSEEMEFLREMAIRSRLAIERQRVEQALRDLAGSLERQVERRLAERDRLWANTRVLMVIVSSNAMIVEVNPAWTDILGWDAHEMAGRSLYEFTDEKGARALSETLLSQNDKSEFRIEVKSSNGQVRCVEWSLSADDGVAYLVGRDVTDQIEVEARLRQSQKMEAIGQLTGGIAHDFNNLLAGITGSLDLLRLRMASNRREDVERYIQSARTAAHRAAALTHRLLAFSRQQPLNPQPVDINRLVVEMEELLRRTLQVRIELELKLEANSLVLTDAHQMENAILNLVINARDAMPRGGKIVIASEDCGTNQPIASRTSRTLEERKQLVCLTVTDNGQGIPPGVVSRVFEPFFTTKAPGAGTGLGLAMIYGFVRQMGGDIELQTEVGKGTTFRMYFPCADLESELAEVDALPVSTRGRGECVLVVEDDEIVRSTIIEMLRELGFGSVGADGPALAIEMLRSESTIALLITDWGLPGLNGGELAQLARERRPELPICFVTGYNVGDVELRALRPNETMLTKPVGIDLLARTVCGLLGEHSHQISNTVTPRRD